MTSAALPRLRSALFHALRTVFRALPVSEATQDRLRQEFLDRFPTIRPTQPRGLAARAAASRRPRVHAGARALGHVERRMEPLPDPLPATVVAFYLPQFHTIPENDEWWGKGFTEWRNVARALPQFEGHAQPRLPADLGFYDLRNPQVMRDQAKLAREYGISAFCFHFYWFGGRTLLESPLEQWLADTSITQSFCLCWANENWTRTWDGRTQDVLISQSHSPEDDLAFIAHVSRYLADPRYLRIEGKPLLLVYRPGLLPDAKATVSRWRAWCNQHGIGEIFIAYVQSFERPDPRELGFDAAVEFPPNLSTPADITARQRLLNPAHEGQVLDWRDMARDYERGSLAPYRVFPGVNCGWDNEPRRPGKGRCYLHASPHAYGEWLQAAIARSPCAFLPADRFVFVNAWNEWAEGAVLEPDQRLGHAWLQATRSALVRAAGGAAPCTPRPCVIVHAWYPETLREILQLLRKSGMACRLIVTTSPEKETQVLAILRSEDAEAELEVGENRGRDILPFLRAAYRLRESGQDLVLKLHTKRSPHLGLGDRWRRELLESLLSPQRVPGILEAFQRDARLGLIAPDGHLLPLEKYGGGNMDNVGHLARRMGISMEAATARFPSGSMFWVRMDALAPLLDAHLAEYEFEPESGQLDGTFAHAIERVFGLAVMARGARIEEVASACGGPAGPSGGGYRYARPG